ncbi:NUDIX hydrolase [Brachybacterium sp. DNPG3]
MTIPSEPVLPLAGESAVPGFLAPLSARARTGSSVLLDRRDARAPRMPAPGRERRSAVLVLIAGTELAEARIVLEERGHRMRSQPGQFALPGGGCDPEDRDDVHTALREAQEETGLEPSDVDVLGAFAPIAMPWRGQRVTPVLARSDAPPVLGVQDPIEVERVVWTPLIGPDSLTDPARRARGMLGDMPIGPVFELPDDVFVWGFTAMILEKVLEGLGLDPVPPDAPERQIPEERRR